MPLATRVAAEDTVDSKRGQPCSVTGGSALEEGSNRHNFGEELESDDVTETPASSGEDSERSESQNIERGEQSNVLSPREHIAWAVGMAAAGNQIEPPTGLEQFWQDLHTHTTKTT